MTLVAQTWPDAVVTVAWIASMGLVLAVLDWSNLRAGRAAIRREASKGDPSA